MIGGSEWIVVTGEIPLHPRLTLIVTPTFARSKGVSEGWGWFGSTYRTRYENRHLGIYAGPRLYLHSKGYFYAQALLSHHHIEKHKQDDDVEVDADASNADFKALGGYAYLGFKIPGKRVAFSADAGLGRKFMEYDSRRTGHALGSFPYWEGVSIDINICLGFNIGTRS